MTNFGSGAAKNVFNILSTAVKKKMVDKKRKLFNFVV